MSELEKEYIKCYIEYGEDHLATIEAYVLLDEEEESE